MSTTSPADEDKLGAEINITPNIKLASFLQDDPANGGSEPGLDTKSSTEGYGPSPRIFLLRRIATCMLPPLLKVARRACSRARTKTKSRSGQWQ